MREIVTARDAVLLLIAAGGLPIGSNLPSCRRLARNLGASHNTVYSAYRELASQGIVRAVQGSGFRLVAELDSVRDEIQEVLWGYLLSALSFAQRGGCSESSVRFQIDAAVRLVYRESAPRVVFVECSQSEASSIARSIECLVSTPIEPVVLDEHRDRFKSLVQGADIVCTTMYHLAEVEEILGLQGRVVGLKHLPEVGCLLGIARIPKGQKVIVVTNNQRTLIALTAVVQTYHGSNPKQVLRNDNDDDVDLADAHVVVAQSDVVQGLKERCRQLNRKLIVVNHQVDAQSISYLQERIYSEIGGLNSCSTRRSFSNQWSLRG